MNNNKKSVFQMIYSYIGFGFFWSFIGFMIWSLINQNELLTLLNKIFG